MQALSPSKTRQWLPSGAARWMSGSPAESSVSLHIAVLGKGLAGCTSARLETLDGRYHEACIISAPAASLLSHAEPLQPEAAQPPGQMKLQHFRHKLMEVGRQSWQRWRGSAAPVAQVRTTWSSSDPLILLRVPGPLASCLEASPDQKSTGQLYSVLRYSADTLVSNANGRLCLWQR